MKVKYILRRNNILAIFLYQLIFFSENGLVDGQETNDKKETTPAEVARPQPAPVATQQQEPAVQPGLTDPQQPTTSNDLQGKWQLPEKICHDIVILANTIFVVIYIKGKRGGGDY